jgi:PKD repeat protein
MKKTLLLLSFIFIAFFVKSQCSAGFVFTQNAGGNITFTSTSTGVFPGTYYQWSYGDSFSGAGTNLTNVSHTYPGNGSYTATLSVFNASVCTSSFTQNIVVSTSPCSVAVNASYTYSNATGGILSFTSTSTGTTVSSTYFWKFGDGGTSTLMNPSHNYAANGNYIARLYVANGPCSDSLVSSVTVTTVPCSLAPSFTYSNSSSGQLYFVSTSTGTVPGTTYSWNFGDATSGSGNPVYHTYATNGTYSVTLTLSNSTFSAPTCSATTTQTVILGTSPCTTAVNASFTYTNTGGGNVNFTSTSTGTTASSTYTWTFGDATSSTVMNPSHTYSANTNYNVVLKVKDGACSNSKMMVIPISSLPCALVPSFTYSNSSSGQLYFVSTSTGTVPGTYYSWNFGDATIGAGNPVYHTYAANGTYSVTLTLTNPSTSVSTCSATVTQTVIMSTSPCSMAINASFTYTNTGGGNVNFTSTSTGTTASSTYSWSFGDSNSSTTMNPSHTYSANSNYNVILKVTDGACNSTKMINVPISSLPCSLVPSFSYSTTSSSGQLYFVSTSTGTVAGSSYYWDFGDLTYGYTNPVNHTYASPGTYSVILVVTNPSSSLSACSASVSQNVSITSTACLANPTFTLAKVTSTAVVWNAYPTYPTNITTAVWAWGDATSSTGLYPSHTYSATGWYNVCLTITVSCSATGSTCVLSNIYRLQAGESAGIAQINVVSGPSIGIVEQSANNSNFNLYPNPNNGIFSLALDPSYNNEPSGLSIYNMLGEVIYTARFDRNESLTKQIDLGGTPNGAYFMKLNTSKGNFSKKLIINR